MLRNLLILGLVALVVAAPLVFQAASVTGGWKPGDPELVIVSPHNECIQYEFEQAFTHWHHTTSRRLGEDRLAQPGRHERNQPVFDFGIRGGVSGVVEKPGQALAGRGGRDLLKDRPPAEAGLAQMWQAFRQTDDPQAFWRSDRSFLRRR